MSRAAIIYLSLTLFVAVGILAATLAIYIIWDKQAPETLSAAVVNTAATLAAATFVGVFDMFFTIAQMRRNEEDRRQWQENLERLLSELQAERELNRAERELNRAERELYLTRLEEDRTRLEEDRTRLEEDRSRQEENQQQTNALFARMLELLERRNGGNGASETPNAR